jgi:hypothetical protein
MPAALDAPILKELGEAAKALDALYRGLGPLVSRLPANVPADKAKPAAVKVHAWLKRYAPVTKVIGSKVHDALAPATQDGLKWLDGTVSDMLKVEAALRKAVRTQDMDFAKDPEGVIKAIKAAAKDAGNPSWMPGTLARIEKDIKIDDDRKKRTEALVKVMQKGQDIGGVPGTAISSLALLVLLHMIWKMLAHKLKDKPKG